MKPLAVGDTKPGSRNNILLVSNLVSYFEKGLSFWHMVGISKGEGEGLGRVLQNF